MLVKNGCFHFGFQSRYHQAKMSIQDRNVKVAGVVESLERDMELICLTGVEDKLQEGVQQTLELLRNAGMKVNLGCVHRVQVYLIVFSASGLSFS